MGLMDIRWRRLYGNPTRHELALEPAIASLGYPYRFQHPVWGAAAFLDYYWPDLRVAVEIDGRWGHSTKEDKEKDRARTARLDRLGILVVRVTNGQVDTNPTKTAQVARARAEKLRDERPLDTHLPSPDLRGGRSGGSARKGTQGRKGRGRKKARLRPGTRRRAPGGNLDVRQGGSQGRIYGPRSFPGGDGSAPPIRPDPPYDPAGDAWGAGVFTDFLNPDFKPE